MNVKFHSPLSSLERELPSPGESPLRRAWGGVIKVNQPGYQFSQLSPPKEELDADDQQQFECLLDIPTNEGFCGQVHITKLS